MSVPTDLSGLRRSSDPAVSVPAPRSRWRTRVLAPAVVLALFGGLLAVAGRDVIFPGVSVRVVPVVVKATAAGELAGTVTSQAAGWVEADPYPTYVSALTDGVVQEVLVLEGERVEAGQVVARLVREDAELALARAAAELLDAQASLQAAGEELKTLVGPRRAVAVASARLAESHSMLAMNDDAIAAQLARVRELAEQVKRDAKLVEAGEVDELTLVRGEAQLAARRAELDGLATRANVLKAQQAQAEADEAAAKEALALLIAEKLAVARAEAAVKLAQAAYDEAALRVQRLDVRSPIAGIVQARHVSPGSKVMLGMDHPASAHVVHVYDPRKLQVRVDVPLAEAARVGVGHEARIVVEVLPDRVFRGEVTRIVHEADLQKNTLQVKVRIDDPSPEIKPEMLARAQFLAPAAPDGERRAVERVLAPLRLIRREGESGGLAFVAAGGRAERRALGLGSARDGDWVEVTSGLSAGDRLIDAPIDDLRDGMRVRVIGESAPERGR